MQWLMIRVQRPLDELLRGTRFMPSAIGGVETPICFLTTVGRATGAARTVPLMFVPMEEGEIAVVASNYGQATHPAWSLNLDANPSAEIAVDDVRSPVTARRASPDEEARLWPRFEAAWPGYETYRTLTDRQIRMYVLTPRPSEA